MERIFNLFKVHPDLVIGFNPFLPSGYCFSRSRDRSGRSVIEMHTPSGTKAYSSFQSPEPTVYNSAYDYVTKVKVRYQHDPATYKKFLQLLEWCKASGMLEVSEIQ